MSGWVKVWLPIMSPSASIRRSSAPPGSYSPIWLPISKNVATACLRSSSATTCRFAAPPKTSDGSVGTQPTGCGLCSLNSGGRAGKSVMHPSGRATAVRGTAVRHNGEARVLSTCQRIEW